MMEILFAVGEATLGEIAKRMNQPPTRPALRSIAVILEKKGHVVRSGKRGRELLFRPKRLSEREGRSAWRGLLDTFFGGSIGKGLAAYLADPGSKVSAEELREIERIVAAARSREENQ